MKKLWFLLAAFFLVPIIAHATVDWDDSFEYANGTAYVANWPGSCSAAEIDSGTIFGLETNLSRVHSGAKSLRLTYPGGQAGGCFQDRQLAGATSVLYTRWWMFLEGLTTVTNFQPDINATKIMRQNLTYPQTDMWWGMSATSLTLMTTVQRSDGTAENFFSSPVSQQQWVCVETEFRQATPGVNNGVLRAWINNTLVLSRTDVRMQPAGATPTGQSYVRMYRQLGTGKIWYDEVATSRDARIGCGTTPLPADTQAPTVPTNLAVSVSGGSTATYSWNASVDGPPSGASGIAGYTVRLCTGAACSPVTVRTTTGSTATSFTDGLLSPSTTYGVSVNAFDLVGNQSAFTLPVSFTTPATFRTTLFTDSFNRADAADIGVDYTGTYTGHNSLQIVSQRLLSTTVNTPALERYTGVSTPNDQWCEITIGAFTGAFNDDVSCSLRMSAPPTVNLYRFRASINGTNKASLRRFDSGTSTDIGNDTTVVWSTGDKLRGEVEGTTLRLYRTAFGTTNATLLLTTTDATYASGSTGVHIVVPTGAVLADAQISQFSMGGFSAGTPATTSFDAISDSAPNNTTNTINWSHTIGNCANRLLIVAPEARDDASASDVAVTNVTYQGSPLTKIRANIATDVTASIGTELWQLVNPGAGLGTVAITWAGALSRVGVGSAISFCGVDQSTPIDAHAGNSATSGTTISAVITTTTANAWIVDNVAARPADAVIVGAGQTERANRIAGSAIGIGVSTVNGKVTPGAETMDWTKPLSGHWASSAVSIRPATVTPVVPPRINSVVVDNTGANVTFGATTPTTVRVDFGNNAGTFSDSVIEPISAFPSGRYTRTWLDGLNFAGFHARDSLGVENTNPADFIYVNLAGVSDPIDTAAAVMSSPFPSSTLPAGTTAATIGFRIDKPSPCRYHTSDTTYDLMPIANQMSVVSLVASASVTGLAAPGTTTFFGRCNFMDSLVVEHPNLSSISIPVTVATSTTDTTAPSNVVNLVGSAIGQSQGEWTWSVATDNVAIFGYQVYIATGACSTYNVAGNPTPNTFFGVSLAPNTITCVKVKAIDTSNNFSINFSNIASITTGPILDVIPPSTIRNLRLLAAFTNSIILEWDQCIDESGFCVTTIERSPAGCTNFNTFFSGIVINKLALNLSPGTDYCFRAIGSDGTNLSVAYSNVLSITTLTTGLPQPRIDVPFTSPRLPAGTLQQAGQRAPRL